MVTGKVQGFKGSRVQEFKGSRVDNFVKSQKNSLSLEGRGSG